MLGSYLLFLLESRVTNIKVCYWKIHQSFAIKLTQEVHIYTPSISYEILCTLGIYRSSLISTCCNVRSSNVIPPCTIITLAERYIAVLLCSTRVAVQNRNCKYWNVRLKWMVWATFNGLRYSYYIYLTCMINEAIYLIGNARRQESVCSQHRDMNYFVHAGFIKQNRI